MSTARSPVGLGACRCHASCGSGLDARPGPGGPPWASIDDAERPDQAVKPANRRATSAADPAVAEPAPPSDACWPTRAGRSSRSSRARRPGRCAPQPVRVTGPGTAMPRATATHDDAAALALEADGLVGQLGRRPVDERRRGTRAAGAGEIGQPRSSASTATKSATGRGLGERLDEPRLRVDGARGPPRGRTSCGSPGCRRRSRRRRSSRGDATTAAQPDDLLGLLRRC